MALPVLPHRLTKIRAENRVRLIRMAFAFSICAVFGNLFSVGTNEWLHTSEVLKYFVLPNRTADEEQNPPIIYYKNATLGPWLFCWSDPLVNFHCNKIDVFALDDPSDVTTAVELSVRHCVFLMMAGCGLDSLGLLSVCICFIRRHPYSSLLLATVVNIFAGLANFACIIAYITSVSKEIGNKIYKASRIDDSQFHYSYGFSFLLLKVSFLCTEMAALLCVLVYMAKRDERTYNAYRMRSMLRNIRTGGIDSSVSQTDGRCSPFERHLVDNERYYRHARVNTLRRKVSNTSSSCQLDVSQLMPLPAIMSSSSSSTMQCPSPALLDKQKLSASGLLLMPPSPRGRRASMESALSVGLY